MQKTKKTFWKNSLMLLILACLVFPLFNKVSLAEEQDGTVITLPSTDPAGNINFAPGTGGVTPSPVTPQADPGGVVVNTTSTRQETSMSDSTAWFVGTISYPIFEGSAWLLAKAGNVMDMVFSIEKFKGIPAVDTSWKVLRDISNMFFIVLLMLAGIGTIIRFDKFDKKIIVPLIFAIVAINFSKTISYVIIDFTQVLTRTLFSFVGSGNQASVSLGNSMGLTGMFKKAMFWKADGSLIGSWTIVLHLWLATAIQVIAAVAIGIGAILLLERMIYLWILIAISPGAWGLSVIPGQGSYLKQWFDKLFKKAFFAPVYAFYIAFAIILVRSGGYYSATGAAAQDGITEFFRNPMYLLNYLVTIVVLFLGIKYAKDSGGLITSKVAGFANKNFTGLGKWAGNRASFQRIRQQIATEHKARKDDKEKMKQETAKRWSQQAYRFKDKMHQATTVSLGEDFRQAAKDFGFDVEKTGKTGRVLKKHAYSKVEAIETDKARVEANKKFKDSPPDAADILKDLGDPKKKLGEKQALAQFLSQHTGNFAESKDDALKEYKEAMSALKDPKDPTKVSSAQREFENKVKEKRVDLVVQYKIETEHSDKNDIEKAKLFQEEMNKVVGPMGDKILKQSGATWKNKEFIDSIASSPRAVEMVSRKGSDDQWKEILKSKKAKESGRTAGF